MNSLLSSHLLICKESTSDLVRCFYRKGTQVSDSLNLPLLGIQAAKQLLFLFWVQLQQEMRKEAGTTYAEQITQALTQQEHVE